MRRDLYESELSEKSLPKYISLELAESIFRSVDCLSKLDGFFCKGFEFYREFESLNNWKIDCIFKSFVIFYTFVLSIRAKLYLDCKNINSRHIYSYNFKVIIWLFWIKKKFSMYSVPIRIFWTGIYIGSFLNVYFESGM